MKLDLLCTARGLIPIGDESYDEKRKLKIGQVYRADVRVPRNYQFHKKAFALRDAAWELMNEQQQAAWRSKEGFRAYLTVAAGYYDVFWNPRQNEFTEYPKSWSFDNMDEAEFSGLYDRMKDVIFSVLDKRITEEVFNRVLSNF